MRSAYAVFKDPKDAQEAFDNIEGEEEKVYIHLLNVQAL